MRASRRTATGEVVPVSILRDAVLRTAPQDEAPWVSIPSVVQMADPIRGARLTASMRLPGTFVTIGYFLGYTGSNRAGSNVK